MQSLDDILVDLAIGGSLSPFIEQQLVEAFRQDVDRSRAFGVAPETMREAVRSRVQLLRSVYPTFVELCQQTLQIQPLPLTTLWDLWLPLAMQLAAQRQALGHLLVQGILGGQGTGKTTLAHILTLILRQLGYRALSWSLDDLYKTYADRQQLQATDPRLIWRGPPGTHDVELGIQTLDQLRHARKGETIAIPRFDKSAHNGAGDRTVPEQVQAIDIVLFEGWFVGARPITNDAFEQAPPPILTAADRAFARASNDRLHAYLPLWQRLDHLMILSLPNYRLSQQWRQQAEHKMIAQGKPGMSDRQINAFVEYFWRSLHPQLFIEPLIHHPTLTDWVIEIQPDHTPGRIYRPGDRG
ncbi:MAG: glycerate kinase [Scytolyngbya sp. HA4215-MV1]|jgi:D-glycerate 3-kinase|nr:glycerate kinase [Scytolyngbya sp. HA4215-MV1]